MSRPASMHRPNLDAILNDPSNAITPLRLMLALIVVVEHALMLVTPPGTALGIDVFGMSPAYIAVNGFFVLSGALIAKSLISRNGDYAGYFASRLLRLMPLLIVFAGTVMVLGPFLSNLSWSDYIRDPQAILYPLNVLLFLDVSLGTPGAVASNPTPFILGAPLWTLRYELIAYIGTALAFAIGLLHGRARPFLLLAGATGFSLAHEAGLLPDHNIIDPLARFGLCFSVGIVACCLSQHYRPRWWHALLPFVGVALLWDTVLYEIVWAVFLAALLFWMAGWGLGRTLPLTGRGAPDFSYGLYVWHFLVMQILLHLGTPAHSALLFALALPLSAGAAIASWYVVEKPALALKPRATTAMARLHSGLKSGHKRV